MPHSALPTILFYNDDWSCAPQPRDDAAPACRLTFDKALVPEADVVVFHIPTLGGVAGIRKRAGQRWVAWSMESAVNYPQLAHPVYMRQFDFTMGYRRDADIWTPYLDTGLLAPLAEPPQPKTEAALAVYFASNRHDHSGRHDLVAALMRHMNVDSYGRCLRNRTLPGDAGRSTKLATIARYKFTLAFENSIAPDYVTEKFFDPLVAGSVPVYLGAPEVAAFAPGPRCFIDATDFDGPAALARHLQRVAADEDAYARLLAWKADGPDAAFRELVARTAPDLLRRLAALAG